MKTKSKKASSLLLTLLIMAAILSIALGLSRLSLGEMRLSRDDSGSLAAYYAAETGVECQMFADRVGGVTCGSEAIPMCLSADVCVKTTVEGATPNRSIKSDGFYRGSIHRAIELTY